MTTKQSNATLSTDLIIEEQNPIVAALGREVGVPWVWVCGGALATILVMIVALFGIITSQGLLALWPKSIVSATSEDGQTTWTGVPFRRVETAGEKNTTTEKEMLYLANRDFGGEEFVFIPTSAMHSSAAADAAWFVERYEWGPFIGNIKEVVTTNESAELHSPATENAVAKEITNAKERRSLISKLEKEHILSINSKLDSLRLEKKRRLRKAIERHDAHPVDSSDIDEQMETLGHEFDHWSAELQKLNETDSRFKLVLESPEGHVKEVATSQIVRAFHPNSLGIFGKIYVFLQRGFEFLTAEPREANSAGGVFPAIFGTVVMTFLMTLAVMPLGILTAVYIREIAKQGMIVSFVRIAVGNLAGVPSIVYGIFGLGFFCYTVGSTIDSIFFVDKLPNPTFGTGGILWASLTLSLLTVPVVIVATEEALTAVPRTLREASYGCGATRLQTLWHIVLPKAAPGIMTGLILAMARGAGEVAPLLMTGVVKLAPTLPIDGRFPFVHLERSFMHLGFHIYDLGFQSRSTEISRPMVFASTLLLIALVLTLNFFAIKLRSLLRRRFEGRGAF